MSGIYLPEPKADEMDLARDFLIWQDERRQRAPEPQPCHACDAKFAGSHCPICGEERPAYTALKRMTNVAGRDDKELPGSADAVRRSQLSPAPAAPLPQCRYFPSWPCECGGRGTCLPAA